MSEFNAVKIISIYYLLLVEACHCSHYVNYSMESPQICHIFGNKKTNKIRNMTAVIIRPNDPSFWTIERDRSCRFVFKTPPNVGLFAVIQNMYLRGNGTSCVDYVQFKENGHKSKKFCGKIEDVDPRYVFQDDEEDAEQPNFTKPEFISIKGEFETDIFVSKEEPLPEEHLNLRIVYTPWKDCNKIADKIEYPPNENGVCIWKGYYCDGIKNCAFNSCRDEIGCEIIVNDSTGTKVTVGAVTTMLLLFLLFVMCLWTCRKHNKLCWSPDCAGPNVAEVDNQSIDLGTRDQSGGSVIPTSPMLEGTATRPVQDKDLPPSYDSLFPEPSAPTTTTT